MTLSTRSSTRVLAFALSAGVAVASSWLVGELPQEDQGSTNPTLLGLYPADADLRDYQHPFGRKAAEATWHGRTGMLQPETTYLIRTATGPAERRGQRLFMRDHLKKATDAGLRFVGATIHRGAAHTPLMGIAQFTKDTATAVPEGLVAIEVTSAEVHLCLLGLGESPDGSDSREAPLQISAPLTPAQAMRRAQAVARHAAVTWGVSKQTNMTLEQMRQIWPEAVQNLLDHGTPEEAILLAQRVIWKAGDREIPGPGGTMLKTTNHPAAAQRLQKLYSPVGLPKE